MKLTCLHSKQPLQRYQLTLLIVMAFSFMFMACGGSGGSGGSSSPAASYTGATNQALITEANSTVLIDDSFEGAVTSDAMVPFGVGAAQAENGQAPMPVKLQAAFAGSLAGALDAPASDSSDQRGALAESYSETINGECGGSASFNMTANEQNGAFSGSFSYNSYCDGGVTLSGSATFAGRIDTSSNEIEYFTFSFSNMTTTTEGHSSSLTGTLAYDDLGTSILITADIVVADNIAGLVCWLNDYSIQITGNQMEISGRYYDQEHGYIDFATVEPLIVSDFDRYPSAGLVVFTGAVGINGQPTKAHLRAVSATQCQVLADFDGDGVLEYDSGVMLWDEL